MRNILTIFLLTSTFFTGILWIIDHILLIKNYFYNKKKTKNNNTILINKVILENKKCFFRSLSSLFPTFFIVFIIRSFIYEPFQIPSGSMMPTLLIGDFILVKKFSYGIKEPITNKTIIKMNLPQRGDIVVFKHPKNNIDYIKRVVGLPGDKIQYDINRKKIKICINYTNQKNCENKLFITYSKPKLSNFFQKIYLLKSRTNEEEKVYNSIYFKKVEEKINNLKHNILILDGINSKINDYYQQKGMPKLIWIVPKNKYFMMGDNRDNSLDSRYWGFVPEENLLGKATKIWMSFEKKENEWPTGIRIKRIGNIY
ncbi:signal peptidase I [Buchnera aphidicola]|uniref:Signal peptidase I n=1 Tax=Buchnera aphidicola subsp. Schizaphis graminum (strain Sg) TaxID=198804 RepID=LEP_BUCAP|nr:signal peptidase I [Buchnera aphidicola]Q8K9R0.1 RecName: Full=Signal peptidase I; Short=SPase I; AltName: Full=Leader peptidase I [Buchnera aphidicola str. Sg (Schizaphis graminum)]AAM67809.1 signal peptidase I [Buchnera aphidicola str. Sg (Schizaphis graminum)]AWI49693.1 S26 family signal peptidase [Buchnera aphidicola (Schizaphis graminum)]